MNQENLISMLLNKNEILSSGNWEKPIRVRYFLIKDITAMGDLKVEYFQTGKMLADHFTKPLQGTAFRKFRAEIQGILEYNPDTDLGWDRPENTFIPITQDCVEKSEVKTENRTNESRGGSPVE